MTESLSKVKGVAVITVVYLILIYCVIAVDWPFYKPLLPLLYGFLIVFAVKGSKQNLFGFTVRNVFAFIVTNSIVFMINGTFVAWVPTVIGYFAVNQRLYIISGGYFAYKVINTRREKPADALL